MPSNSAHFRLRPGVARPTPRAARRGSALLLAIIGLFAVALLATAAVRMTGSESAVHENAQAGAQAMYMADQALAQYYQNYKPQDNLVSATTLTTVIDTTDGDIDTSSFLFDFSSSDLKMSDIVNGTTTVRITPTKMMTSPLGDVYMVDATAITTDPRPNRPPAVRSLRTYARLEPPIAIRAALMAPGGLYANGRGRANRIILRGTRKDKCTAATSVPSLATPAGVYDYKQANKKEIIQDVHGVGHDSSTATYQELRDSLKYNWPVLSSQATYDKVPNSIVIPRDYATLGAVPFSTFSKSGYWPVIFVKGDVNLIGKETKGFGMLVVEGSLNVTSGVLKWEGLILVGGRLTVVNGGDKSHTHIKGAVAAGLSCNTPADLATGKCRTELATIRTDGEHLGINFSFCNVQASWNGMMLLRPVTPTRHLKLY